MKVKHLLYTLLLFITIIKPGN
ncbi:MAG: hypothetical protein RIR96_1697, partial [Bacteroidota bacterium]